MNRFLKLGANPRNGKDFVIGDVHGKYTLLMEGLERVNFDYDKDRLFCVGDLIDRGYENMQCLELIWEKWFYTVIGNHELMMAQSWTDRRQYAMWTQNGGHWFYTLDEEDKEILENIYTPEILNTLPIGLEFQAENGKRVGITHADIPIQWPWWEVRKHLQGLHEDALKLGDVIVNTILWSRAKINDPTYQKEVYGADLVIHGHSPSKKIVWRGNAVFIDLGQCNPYQMIPIDVMELYERQDKRRAEEMAAIEDTE